VSELVHVDDADFARAVALAEQTLAIFSQRPRHYNNTLNSHLRGKVGETACAKWLARQGVEIDSAFQDVDRMQEADLIVRGSNPLRLDIKTWDARYWPTLGRCVAVGQLPALQKKADGAMWCVCPSALEPGIDVEIVGWSTLDEIVNAPRRMTGPAGRRQVDNYQLDLHRIGTLASLLDRIRQATT